MFIRRSRRILALVLSPLLTVTFFNALPAAPTHAATVSTPDAHTVILDHFDGSTTGMPIGTLTYGPSLTDLGQAGVFHGNFVMYPITTGMSQGTVEMWVKLDSLPTESRGFLNFNWYGTTSYPGMGHVLHMGVNYPANASGPAYAGYGSFWPSGHAYGDTPLAAGEWTHLALSWGPAGTKFYTNGVPSGGPSSGGSPSSPAWAYLNYWGSAGGGGGIDGLIDEFHVSDIQRSDAYIAADADKGSDSSIVNGEFTSGLTGWTQATQMSGYWTVTGGPLHDGYSVPIPPNASHTTAASYSYGGLGSHVLWQDLTLPAGYEHLLELDYFYQSWSTWSSPWMTPSYDTLDPWFTYGWNQQARIEVLRASASPWSVAPSDILATGFRTTSSTPAAPAGWQHLTMDLTPFAGQTVRLRFADVENVHVATLAVTNVSLTSTSLAVDTTTTLTSNHNPSVFGQPVTFTATVSRDVAGPTPTGSVLFSEVMPDTTLQPLGEVDLVDGVATLTRDGLAVGNHEIRAAYSGAGIMQPSSDDLTQAVHKADTTTGLDVTPSATVTYPASQTLSAHVTAVSPGAGTPTGDVHFQSYVAGSWTTFATATLDGTGHASATVSLDAGVTQVRARYPGDDSFGSSAVQANLTVNKASTTVQYTGPYLVLLGKSLALSADVSSAVTSCTSGRTVRFVVSLNGTVKADVVGNHVSGGTYAYSLAIPSSWTPGVYDVQVLVEESTNCLAAQTALGDDLVTVASPGDAATGGGWYQLPDGSGPAKRVSFGFTTRWDKATESFKGNLLLVNKQAWRLKGEIDTYGTTSCGAAASGTGTLYRADCTTVEGVTTCEWVDPVAVTFDIGFTDVASGKSGKRAAVVDKFALTHLSVSGDTLPTSTLQPLKGGNITIR